MEGALPHNNLPSMVQELAVASGALGSDDSSKRLATTLSKEADRLSQSQKQHQQPVLLVTTVDIGGGRSDRIEVRRGDDPSDVARAFCTRHGLPPAIVAPLTGHLEDNLRKAAAAAAASAAGAAVGAGAEKEPQAAAAAGAGSREPDLKPSVDGRPSPSPSIPMGPFPTESPRMPGAYGSTSPQLTPGGPAANNKTYSNSSAADGGSKQAMTYSFASGMDDRAYEQLSSKLLDDSAAGARRGAKDHWVNASEVLAGSGGSGLASKRSSSGASGIGAGALGAFSFGGKPAGPTASVSPRDGTVHSRLYAGAQDRASRLEERRRAAAAENEATLAAGKATRMSWISAEMMRGRSHTGMYDNYGTMLYTEGVESLMSRLKKAEAERKAREDRELEGLTFTPAITKKAWELKQRERDSMAGGLSLSGLSLDGSAAAAGEEEKWLRLHVRGVRKSTLERLDLLREQQKAAEVAECTFKPRINRNSDTLMNERAETLKVLNITHYEQLYADALRRQSKAEEAQQWYPDGVTFQPQVNKDPKSRDYARRSWEKAAKALQQQRQQQQRGGSSGSSPGMGMGGAGSVGAGDDARGPAGTSSASLLSMSVVDRLYSEAERKEAKLEAARQLYHGSVDPATGKPLYRPETGRGPKGGHAAARRGGQGVGDYLYAAARDLQARKEARVEAERRAAAEEAARSRTTATSQRMFASLKAKRFRQIFEYLDEEGAGSLDLLAVLGRSPANADPQAPPARSPRVDDLDPEVLLDVEAAAEVWARANGMLLTPAEQAAAALINGQDAATAATTTSQAAQNHDPQQQQPSPRTVAACDAPATLLAGPCPPLSLEMFGSLMEEALALRRGPRSYLCPSPSAKQGPAHSYRPHVNAKSRALAAKLRPDHVATFELLHKVAEQTHERLEALRREKEAAGLQGCTFQPQLNASSRHVEGRALNRASSSLYAQPGANTAASVRLSLGQAQPDHPGSSFAAAAAGIAAAAGFAPPPLAHAEEEAEEQYGSGAAAAGAGDGPNDLDQQLRELRMAAAQAAGVQAELEAQRRATGSHGGGGGGGGVGYGSGGEDDLALESFAQELKDLQAVAQLCISGVQQAQQEHRAEQQQQRRASGSMGGHVPAAVAAGAPAGGLQELAAALGTWDHRADPTMATLQQQ